MYIFSQLAEVAELHRSLVLRIPICIAPCVAGIAPVRTSTDCALP